MAQDLSPQQKQPVFISFKFVCICLRWFTHHTTENWALCASGLTHHPPPSRKQLVISNPSRVWSRGSLPCVPREPEALAKKEGPILRPQSLKHTHHPAGVLAIPRNASRNEASIPGHRPLTYSPSIKKETCYHFIFPPWRTLPLFSVVLKEVARSPLVDPGSLTMSIFLLGSKKSLPFLEWIKNAPIQFSYKIQKSQPQLCRVWQEDPGVRPLEELCLVV